MNYFFGSTGKYRVNIHHFIEWGQIIFVANKAAKTKKNYNKGTAMLMVRCELDSPSGI